MMNETLDCIDHNAEGTLQIKDTGRMFITVNSKVAPQNNPALALVRFQLMEFIIRCAMEKYLVAGIVTSAIDAIKMFNETYTVPRIASNFDEGKWRLNKTFNVYVDNVLKAFKLTPTHFQHTFQDVHRYMFQTYSTRRSSHV